MGNTNELNFLWSGHEGLSDRSRETKEVVCEILAGAWMVVLVFAWTVVLWAITP